MNDEQDDYNSVNFAHPALIVASTVAALVLAGSAVFWRSNLRNLIPHESNHFNEQSQVGGESASKSSRSKERRRRGKDPMKELLKGGKKARDLARLLKTVELGSPESALSTSNSISQEPTSCMPERSRSRDQSSSRSVSSASASSSRLPDSGHSRGPSLSRSFDDNEKVQDAGDIALTIPVLSPVEDFDDDFNATPKERSSEAALPSSSTLPTIHHPHSPATSHDSTSSLAAFSAASVSDSPSTVATSIQSPVITSTKELQDEQPAVPSPPNSTRRNKNKKPDRNHSDSKNGNLPSSHSLLPASSSSSTVRAGSSNIPSPSPSPSTSHTRKPPRFRSKSRQPHGSADAYVSPSLPESIATEEEHDYAIPISFPTLNGPVNGVSDPFAVGGTPNRSLIVNGAALPPVSSNSESAAGSSRGVMTGHATTSRHPPPRTPTPSHSGTSTPSQSAGSSGNGSAGLSTQTQIASLRGALEAARMREEKSREQLDKVSKEVEMLRWEGNAWRRREAELHTQIRHLMHQLHAYAYVMPQAPLPGQLHHLQVPATQSGASPSPSGSSSPSPNPYAQSPLPGPSQQSQPSASVSANGSSSGSASTINSPTISSPINGLTGVNGMFSPLGMGMMSPMSLSAYSSPHSPFFPYPMGPSSPSSATQPSMQGAQSAQNRLASFPPQVHPTQFMNLLNMGGGAPGSSAAAMGMGMGMGMGYGLGLNVNGNGNMQASSSTSSVGSEEMSLDGVANTSPSPATRGAFDRGRRRGRARQQAASVRVGHGGGLTAGADAVGEPAEDLVAEDEGNESGSGGSGSAERHRYYEEDGEAYDEEDGGVNELLADAILKRPESIRLGSVRRRTNEREKEEREKDKQGTNMGEEGPITLNSPAHSESRQTETEITNDSDSPIEFTFPSISDWGNAYRANSRSAKTTVAAAVRGTGSQDSALCGEGDLEVDEQQRAVTIELGARAEAEEEVENTPPAASDKDSSLVETPTKGLSKSEQPDASIIEV